MTEWHSIDSKEHIVEISYAKKGNAILRDFPSEAVPGQTISGQVGVKNTNSIVGIMTFHLELYEVRLGPDKLLGRDYPYYDEEQGKWVWSDDSKKWTAAYVDAGKEFVLSAAIKVPTISKLKIKVIAWAYY